MWVVRRGTSRGRRARRSRLVTRDADGLAATGLPPGHRDTTSFSGRVEARPICRTWSCCATAITGWCMRVRGSSCERTTAGCWRYHRRWTVHYLEREVPAKRRREGPPVFDYVGAPSMNLFKTG